MADYAAQGVRGSQSSTALTRRTGSASADRVPSGSRVVFNNTGAGAHVVTFVNTGTFNGRTVGNQTVNVAAGAGADYTVDSALDGDLDGWVSIQIDGTATEVQYYVLGA
jgi:hypothetical protein